MNLDYQEGTKIGCNALWNKIMAIWKPIAQIKLVDLENEYYMIKFKAMEDYTKALSEGPWIIYGNYFTV
ncbi:hypothetical protein Gotri_028162 [Gossypium trilobum]|uniref:DUF4283 domain-containing protein n=1 Tax=Gossypium trilobum TaxID=34281 RepID=A0A7J9FXC3_9ROSI|nr:hypothetical protein [Gossypium trilobum]